MADGSGIEWTEATWNPTTGCDQISAGCDNCYALTLAKRLKAMGNPKYQTDGSAATSGPGFGLKTHAEVLSIPTRWKKPRLVFVNSMSDLFHARVPTPFIEAVFEEMAANPRHTFQLLTKRPMRAVRLSAILNWAPNVWMGVTVEDQKNRWRIDELRKLPAAIRFVSAEPLLSPLPGLNLDGIDWLIAGGESGSRFRPVDPSWVADLRDQCAVSRTQFFFKQWGGVRPKTGGRLLDGRTWDDMPSRTTNPTEE